MPRSSRGLGRRPFTAVTRVQIPYAVLYKSHNVILYFTLWLFLFFVQSSQNDFSPFNGLIELFQHFF